MKFENEDGSLREPWRSLGAPVLLVVWAAAHVAISVAALGAMTWGTLTGKRPPEKNDLRARFP